MCIHVFHHKTWIECPPTTENIARLVSMLNYAPFSFLWLLEKPAYPGKSFYRWRRLSCRDIYRTFLPKLKYCLASRVNSTCWSSVPIHAPQRSKRRPMSTLKLIAWMHIVLLVVDKGHPEVCPFLCLGPYTVRFIICVKNIGVFTRSKVMGVLIFDDIVPDGRFRVRIGH